MAEYVGKISKQKRSSKSRSRKIKRSNRITAKEIDDFIINEMKTKKGKYTGEEEFLLKYFNIQSTNIPRRKLRLSKFSKEKYHKYKITDDELQIHRYKALIDFLKLYIEIKDKYLKLSLNESNINNEAIKYFEDESEIEKDYEKNTTIVKKMRNLLILNRIAHNSLDMVKNILLLKFPNLKKLEKGNMNFVQGHIKNFFDEDKNISNEARKRLLKYFSQDELNLIYKNQSIRFCSEVTKWMFKEKGNYILEIVDELKNNNYGYNYGLSKDKINRPLILFDIPGYGQFSVHLGKNAKEMVEKLKQCGIKEFDGENARQKMFLLKRPTKSKEQKIYTEKAPKYLEELIKQNPYKSPTSIKIEKNRIQNIIANCKDTKKAEEIYQLLQQYEIDLENITKEVLENADIDLIPEIIDFIKENNINLSKVKGLLAINENQLLYIYQTISILKNRGINNSILQESPQFLKNVKVEYIDDILRILKIYKIPFSNKNLGNAFKSNPKNIEENLDLLIEEGVYSSSKENLTRTFSIKSSSLNMKINLLKKYGINLAKRENKKLKINAKIFKSKNQLSSEFKIGVQEILKRFSKKQGQYLVKKSKYCKYIDSKENIVLNNKKMQMLNEIYSNIESSETQKGIQLSIGIYNYSVPKVKRQISKILENIDVQNLEEKEKQNILKIALLYNKNINKDEVEYISKYIVKAEEENKKKKILAQKSKEERKEKRLRDLQKKSKENLKAIKMLQKLQDKEDNAEQLQKEIDKLLRKQQILEKRIEDLIKNKGSIQK